MMEVGEVRILSREVTTYSVEVSGPNGTISLNTDEKGLVKIMGQVYLEKPVTRFRFAEFNSAYLRQVHAAIGAVLEAMEN